LQCEDDRGVSTALSVARSARGAGRELLRSGSEVRPDLLDRRGPVFHAGDACDASVQRTADDARAIDAHHGADPLEAAAVADDDRLGAGPVAPGAVEKCPSLSLQRGG